MKSIELFNPKLSSNLFGLQKQFEFLISLYKTKKFPKVLLLRGAKGIGKSTLVNHFLHYVYDEKNYDLTLNFNERNKNPRVGGSNPLWVTLAQPHGISLSCHLNILFYSLE